IDDGSTDNTLDKIENFKKKADFEIISASQVNQGKPSAINHGCKLSRREFIFIVDSDDCLTYDAIEWLLKGISEAEIKGIEYSGVGFRKSEFDGTLSGISFDDNPLDYALYLNATDASNLLKGEMAFCFKRDLMLKIPFPLHAGEKFVPEGLIWTQITDFACVRFYINKVVYLYDYLE
ncbi:glycosyltransferase family 2 protein, partial [Citrobacter werkmanii]|uniref:glycosyltransferase family 2 protein n=1 Tax=Citrobacter werkmanii TaxID=67827 RepID=UPI00101C2628